MSVELAEVDWETALRSLSERYRVDETARSPLAEAESISALFETELSRAAQRIKEAIDLEPLNPIHRVRSALVDLRFGRFDSALDQLSGLLEMMPTSAHLTYLKAVAYLRMGDLPRAKAVVSELVDRHPQHVAGRFLHTEVMLHFKFKGIERNLTTLPKNDAAYVPSWADLLIKIALAHAEGPRLAERYLDRLPTESPERGMVEWILELASGGEDAFAGFEQKLAALEPDSREEQVALLLYRLHLDRGQVSLVEAFEGLHQRLPGRACVRRMFAAALTQRSVDAAADHRYDEALRIVEACLRLEPHETIHHQNRAALFTLLRDDRAYHQSWEELERHHLRLALLGCLDREHALTMAKPHRMFAAQARLSPGVHAGQPPGVHAGQPPGVHAGQPPGKNLGLLREVREGEQTLLELNRERIETDPELVRQWIHHRRAELALLHLALGFEPNRFLLSPSDVRQARRRAKALGESLDSLAVLVADEGARLATELAARWRALAERVDTKYEAHPQDEELAVLAKEHLETFADLALIAFTWPHELPRADLIEELCDFVRSEAPFFDPRSLFEQKRDELSANARRLAFVLRRVLEIPEHVERPDLSDSHTQRFAQHLESRLLTQQALSIFTQSNRREGVERALAILDRARTMDPEAPETEFWAARLSVAGEFFDEAKRAVGEFYRKSKGRPDEGLAAHLEEIQRVIEGAREQAAPDILSSRRIHPVLGIAGRRRQDLDPEVFEAGDRIKDLEAQIERMPGSIASYEELVRALLLEGGFEHASRWAARAVARCLSRPAQLSARGLQMECEGLAPLDHAAVRLFVAGTAEPLLELLEARRERTYQQEYLLGLCLIAQKRRNDARAAFDRALAACDRQIHRPVLRELAKDVEGPILAGARQSIDLAVREGRFDDATNEARHALMDLEAPEALLIDLARIQLAALLVRMGTTAAPPPIPEIANRSFTGRLKAASALETGVERTRALAELAADLHEPSKKEAESILFKVSTLERQLEVVRALNDSGKLIRSEQFAEALRLLDPLPDEPRVVRQRTLLLLKLERFDEADRAIETLRGASDPASREVVERYPSLVFQHRMAAANQKLRSGDSNAAIELLRDLVAPTPDDALELGYSSAFARAQSAYHARAKDDHRTARELVAEALRIAESSLSGHNHKRLVELVARLEKDLTDLEARA